MTKIDFIQLGACNGPSDSDIMWIIGPKFNWKGIFVEPNPVAFEKLKKYYANIEGHYFEQVAVAGTAQDNLTLYCSSAVEQFGSLIQNYRHDLTFQVSCLSLMDIVSKYNLLNIEFELLQIDIEGKDGEVILSTDFNTILPKVVRYESIHMPASQIKKIKNYLASFGYKQINDPYYDDYKANGGQEPKEFNTTFKRR
jgi:FkbM family methyltransferase